jgi:hypothetical protein
MINNPPQLFYNDYIWTEIFTNDEPDNQSSEISCNFDYETMPDGIKHIFIDIGFSSNKAKVMFRSGFNFEDNQMSWKQIFTHDVLLNFINSAIHITHKAFIDFCSIKNISYPENLKFDQVLPNNIATSIIELYQNRRSIEDEKNAHLIKIIALECKTGTEPTLIFKTTFAILDELMFFNPQFNNKHNRIAFSDCIPMPCYITLRRYCLLVETEDIQLNLLNTIRFFQCLDCALQMLMDDKYDTILKSLASKSMDQDYINDYIKAGTDLFDQLHEMLKPSKARLLNLEELPDWNSILN